MNFVLAASGLWAASIQNSDPACVCLTTNSCPDDTCEKKRSKTDRVKSILKRSRTSESTATNKANVEVQSVDCIECPTCEGCHNNVKRTVREKTVYRTYPVLVDEPEELYESVRYDTTTDGHTPKRGFRERVKRIFSRDKGDKVRTEYDTYGDNVIVSNVGNGKIVQVANGNSHVVRTQSAPVEVVREVHTAVEPSTRVLKSQQVFTYPTSVVRRETVQPKVTTMIREQRILKPQTKQVEVIQEVPAPSKRVYKIVEEQEQPISVTKRHVECCETLNGKLVCSACAKELDPIVTEILEERTHYVDNPYHVKAKMSMRDKLSMRRSHQKIKKTSASRYIVDDGVETSTITQPTVLTTVEQTAA